MLDGGPGRDDMSGQAGADVLLARDGERDQVQRAGSPSDGGFGGDRATLDTRR